jgi:hypothetical protein
MIFHFLSLDLFEFLLQQVVQSLSLHHEHANLVLEVLDLSVLMLVRAKSVLVA